MHLAQHSENVSKYKNRPESTEDKMTDNQQGKEFVWINIFKKKETLKKKKKTEVHPNCKN